MFNVKIKNFYNTIRKRRIEFKDFKKKKLFFNNTETWDLYTFMFVHNVKVFKKKSKQINNNNL